MKKDLYLKILDLLKVLNVGGTITNTRKLFVNINISQLYENDYNNKDTLMVHLRKLIITLLN